MMNIDQLTIELDGMKIAALDELYDFVIMKSGVIIMEEMVMEDIPKDLGCDGKLIPRYVSDIVWGITHKITQVLPEVKEMIVRSICKVLDSEENTEKRAQIQSDYSAFCDKLKADAVEKKKEYRYKLDNTLPDYIESLGLLHRANCIFGRERKRKEYVDFVFDHLGRDEMNHDLYEAMIKMLEEAAAKVSEYECSGEKNGTAE